MAGRSLTSELREWLDRLYEDIVSLPIVRQFPEHARTIDQLKELLETLPDEPISQADIETYREDLEKLKAELFERLEKEVGDTEQLNNYRLKAVDSRSTESRAAAEAA